MGVKCTILKNNLDKLNRIVVQTIHELKVRDIQKFIHVDKKEIVNAGLEIIEYIFTLSS